MQNKIEKTLEKILHIHYNIRVHATMAQLVEQRIRNAQAVGSSPTSSSIYGELSEWSKVQHSKCCVGKLT